MSKELCIEEEGSREEFFEGDLNDIINYDVGYDLVNNGTITKQEYEEIRKATDILSGVFQDAGYTH